MKPYIPNAWETHGDTYHVAQNCAHASDDNPGTESLPLKTISAATPLTRDFQDRAVQRNGAQVEHELAGIQTTAFNRYDVPVSRIFKGRVPKEKFIHLPGR